MNRPLLLAVAATVYLTAAWMVAPGFYDGIAPQQPYNFVCLPPIAGANSGQPAQPGHLVIKVIDGISDTNSVFTNDGQVIVSFLPGAFDANDDLRLSFGVKPVSPCPNPPDLHFSTNVYLVTADTPLIQTASAAEPCQPSCIGLRYSNLIPAPGVIYRAADANGPWKSIGGTEAQPFVIRTPTNQLGYFAAGYPANATSKPTGTSQLLPIAVAVLIVGVLVASIPLAMVRRRRGNHVDEENEEDETEIIPRT